jgi:hypothetical protein
MNLQTLLVFYLFLGGLATTDDAEIINVGLLSLSGRIWLLLMMQKSSMQTCHWHDGLAEADTRWGMPT